MPLATLHGKGGATGPKTSRGKGRASRCRIRMTDKQFARLMVDELNARAVPGIPRLAIDAAGGILTVGGCLAGIRRVSLPEVYAWWLQVRQTCLGQLSLGVWPYVDEDGYQAAGP